MNTMRRIRIGAAAVIVNAVAALVALSPEPASAAACGQKILCVSTFACQGSAGAICAANAPAGCEVANYGCNLGTSCGNNKTFLICNYQ